MHKSLKLTDILVTFVIAIVFGILYHFWNPVYDILKPFGFHLEQLLYGFWFMAATVAFLIIRKPGVALLAEMAAASGEIFLGVGGGVEVLLYGFIQGLLAELVLWLFRYRANILAISIAGLASAIGSLSIDWLKGYLELEGWNLALMVSFRIVSAMIFTGFIAKLLVHTLEKMGTISMVRDVDMGEADSFEQNKHK